MGIILPSDFAEHLNWLDIKGNSDLPTSIHPSGPFSVQSVGAAEAVSWAVGYNPGQVATPTQDTSKLALILPTSERRQAESTPPGINSTAEGDLNSGS